jgi:small nuclear ribonucleoprotein (snRNP)-like protein
MSQKKDFKKKEQILDLEKYKDQSIQVTFQSRTVTGILKGFDLLQNLVLDSCVDETGRNLGLVVCRGPGIVTINPMEGFQSIDNPF